MATKFFKYNDAQKQEALRLRGAGLSLKEIETQTSVSQGTLRSWFASAGLTLSNDQRRRNSTQRLFSAEQEQQILADRQTGMTREVLCQKYGVGLPYLKTLLSRNQTTIPMEQRQKNAYEAKLERNPGAMADMRRSLTPDVIARRSASIRTAYEDPQLRELKRDQSNRWWNSLSETERARYVGSIQKGISESDIVKAYRWYLRSLRGQKNYKSVMIMERHGVKTMEELMQIYATKHGGKFVGKYDHSLEKCSWTCKEGHDFTMKPNNVQQGQWCPRCSHTISRSEQALFAWIREIYPDAQPNVRGLLPNKRMELDIWVPSISKAIEFDGDYWHDQEDARRRDLIKNRETARLGIALMRVRYSDWVADPETTKIQIKLFLGR